MPSAAFGANLTERIDRLAGGRHAAYEISDADRRDPAIRRTWRGHPAYIGVMASNVVACPSCGTKNRLPVSAKGHPRCPKCKTDLPWLVDAGDADFDAAVATSVLVVVDLWAPWCGPCRMIAPVLEQVSRELAGTVKVVKVNVDDNPQLSMRFKAQSIPMLLLLRNGVVIDTMIGAQPAPILRSRIQGALDRP